MRVVKWSLLGILRRWTYPREESGLIEARRILKKIPGLYFHEFDHEDVVRHPLVSAIISAYQPRSVT